MDKEEEGRFLSVLGDKLSWAPSSPLGGAADHARLCKGYRKSGWFSRGGSQRRPRGKKEPLCEKGGLFPTSCSPTGPP